MTEQDIQDFWKTCEDELKKYTDEFNNKMGVHGFKVEYIVLDKIPVALIYGLIMKYQCSELHSAELSDLSFNASCRRNYNKY